MASVCPFSQADRPPAPVQMAPLGHRDVTAAASGGYERAVAAPAARPVGARWWRDRRHRIGNPGTQADEIRNNSDGALLHTKRSLGDRALDRTRSANRLPLHSSL